MWPFECIGPDGQIYLHNDNWKTFLKERDSEYPHNWEHRRAILTLCLPRDEFRQIPGVTDNTVLNFKDDELSTIFQPYPAHLRTGSNPDGKESFNLIVEDGHINPLGELLVLFSTGDSFFDFDPFEGKPERFAYWRNKYWRVWTATGGGIGVHPPPVKRDLKPKPVPQYRSLDDEWQ